MLYNVFMILSLLMLAAAGVFAAHVGKSYQSSRIATPSRALAVGVFASGVLLFFPYYYGTEFGNVPTLLRLWESFWLSVHHAIRLFVVDTGFDEIRHVSTLCGSTLYAILGTVLLILAPLLTFTVILSFFRNFSAYRRFLLHPMAPVCVFSELNEKSLTLAKDIKRTSPETVLMFADVFEEDNEESYEITERAKELGAICFKKDMLSLNLRMHSRKSKLSFFAIAQEQSISGIRRQVLTASTAEDENIKQAYKLASDPYYSQRKNTYLYVFSSGTRGELLLENLPDTMVRVSLAEKYRPLVTREIHKHGKELLFDSAELLENGEKAIRVAIVGAGDFGLEMMRTILWHCQIDGYRLSIDVFDVDPDTEDRFSFLFPGLTSPEYNGVRKDGMPYYKLTFHSGVSVDTQTFLEKIDEGGYPTYILVALGKDELAVQTAVALRRHYRQVHCPYDPVIHTIIYDSANKKVFEGAHHWGGQCYDIRYFGDLETAYSTDTIIGSRLEDEALRMHMKYQRDTEEGLKSFYGNLYFKRASVAAAMYKDLLLSLGEIPNVPEEAWSDEERLRFEKNEHRRWVAFMLTEGYVYSGSPNRRSMDRLGKTHHLMLPFDEL